LEVAVRGAKRYEDGVNREAGSGRFDRAAKSGRCVQ
jgi:hypothetical protein